ncbi:hypothetical protein FQZ97_710510 [compost metagenome]
MADGQLFLEASVHAQLHGEPGHDQGEDGQARQHQLAMPEQCVLDAWQHATHRDFRQLYRTVHDRPHREREITKPT